MTSVDRENKIKQRNGRAAHSDIMLVNGRDIDRRSSININSVGT